MLPLASTRFAPKDWKTAPAVSTESAVEPRPMPNGKPALWQASAALSSASMVQASALGGAPTGYIACTSMPACCFIRSMREHGPLIWLLTQAGMPRQWPSARARYSTVGLTLPLVLISSLMISSTGSGRLAWACGGPLREEQIG